MSTFSVSGDRILSHIMPRSADDDTVTDLHYYDINMTISDHKSRFGDMSANLLTGELPNQPVYISSYYLAIQFTIRGQRREV